MTECQMKLSNSEGRGSDPVVLFYNSVWELWENNTPPPECRAGDSKVKGRE